MRAHAAYRALILIVTSWGCRVCGVSTEAVCEAIHKASPQKRAATAGGSACHAAVWSSGEQAASRRVVFVAEALLEYIADVPGGAQVECPVFQYRGAQQVRWPWTWSQMACTRRYPGFSPPKRDQASSPRTSGRQCSTGSAGYRSTYRPGGHQARTAARPRGDIRESATGQDPARRHDSSSRGDVSAGLRRTGHQSRCARLTLTDARSTR